MDLHNNQSDSHRSIVKVSTTNKIHTDVHVEIVDTVFAKKMISEKNDFSPGK